MIEVTNLSEEPHQKTTILLSDNTSVVITLDFRPVTQKWVMSVSHVNFSYSGISLCVHPNLLRSFRRQISFGISCFSSDGSDPFDISDFINGRIKLYVLDNTSGQQDVSEIENTVYQSGL